VGILCLSITLSLILLVIRQFMLIYKKETKFLLYHIVIRIIIFIIHIII
jgi:hypothetical protein